MAAGPPYSVLIVDMFHYDPAEDYTVGGFSDLDTAREYARRRLRDSIEEFRRPGQSAEELRKAWFAFGEDSFVLGDEGPRPFSELEYFLEHPATAEERDWQSIRPPGG